MREQLKNFTKSKIKEFLNSNEETVEFDYISCPADVYEIVGELGGSWKDEEPMDTNGWQYDWWIKCHLPKEDTDSSAEVITIHGSGFYGNGGIFRGE